MDTVVSREFCSAVSIIKPCNFVAVKDIASRAPEAKAVWSLTCLLLAASDSDLHHLLYPFVHNSTLFVMKLFLAITLLLSGSRVFVIGSRLVTHWPYSCCA